MAEESNKGFDAANFLDNYREDIATPVRKPKKQSARQPENEAPEPEVETPPPKPKSGTAKAKQTTEAPISNEESETVSAEAPIQRNISLNGCQSGSQNQDGRWLSLNIIMTKS